MVKKFEITRIFNNFFEKQPCLEQVVAYNNEFVIKNFLKHYDVTDQEARALFKETLKWLWLCNQSKDTERLHMLSLMKIVDEMWHSFILCTKEYDAFCNEYFGKFIHHVPSIEEGSLEVREAMLRDTLSYVYDKLGAETLTKWYSHYPHVYSEAIIKASKKD